MHKTIVTNAGSLRVGDVVLWDNETITEIINQSESSCDCWLRSPNERFMRRHVLSSANALIVVRGGPTLDAANAAGELEVQPSGLPVYKRPAVQPQLVTTAVPLSELYPQPPKVETAFHRDISNDRLAAYLNDGWVILHMQFVLVTETGDYGELIHDHQLHVILKREVRS